MKKFDLEDRLVDFADMIIDVVENLPNSKVSNHLGSQLARSGTAPALLYGEVQAAESNADFLHKAKLVLKELRETQVCHKIIRKRKYLDPILIDKVLQENGELVAIFTASVKTASQNQART
ncbi:MAG: four helix bundle protein [Phycisphaerae bacterium]|nr:four helix bundle protein [Saprospiraceae bacterium]